MSHESTAAKGFYTLKCFRPDGTLRWEASKEENLVVNGGLRDMSQQYFKGSGYTASWFLGLYGAGATNNPAATDTMGAHAGWTEFTGYSLGTRPAAVFADATTANPSVVSNTANPGLVTVNVTGPVTLGGMFLTSSSTKNGTVGVLFSAADFLTPGDRAVYNGDGLQLFYEHWLSAV